MEQDLRSENQRLRLQLKALLTQARKNEEKMRRFNEQEYQLLSTDSLADLIRTVIYNYQSTFELDMVSMLLLDPEHKTAHMLENTGLVLEQTPELVLISNTEQLDELFGVTAKPILAPYDPSRHASFFPTIRKAPRSIALLPLIRGGELIGSLNLGSCQHDRFVTGTSTDFLQRLAAIVAISLENAASRERLRHLGLTDQLTCVNNRRFFEQRLTEEVSDAIRHQESLCCMFLDVDHFKRINDELGHQSGDLVLREIAGLISSQLRSNDIIARYGGEEFVALLPRTTGEQAQEIAERIRASVASHDYQMPGAEGRRVTISIGMSELYGNPELKEVDVLAREFVAIADKALFEAKEQGRNQVVRVQIAHRHITRAVI